MIWVLAAVLLALSLWLVERIWISPAILITTEDLLTSPGRRITLVAEVEKEVYLFWDPPMRGIDVEFFLGDKSLGHATTDATGFARLEIDSAAEGLSTYRVTAGGFSAPLIVKCIAKETPVLICDLDHTTADVSATAFVFRDSRKVRALGGAETVIPELMKRFAIVFLTARDHIFLAKSRAWLRHVGLPEGPLIIRRKRLSQQSPKDHKIERLAELAKEHRLFAGVGDVPGDIEAYLKTGMKAFMMKPRGDGPIPENCQRVRNWTELAGMLKETPGS